MELNNFDLGGDTVTSGNTDMGSGVSVVSGEDVGPGQQPNRLVLMKIREEWWEESQKILEDRNDQIAEAIRGGAVGANSPGARPTDASQRYTRGTENLFTKRRA